MNELLGWYGYEGVDRLDLSPKVILNSDKCTKNNNCNGINQRDDNVSSNHDSSRENSKSPCLMKTIAKQGNAITHFLNIIIKISIKSGMKYS